MKRLLTLSLMGFLGMAGTGYSQEIPDGMKKIMEQLQTDPKAEYGFDYAKERRYIGPDVRFEDWFVGLPIEFYKLNCEALEKADTNIGIKESIVSTNTWRIPIRVNGQYIYHVMVSDEHINFRSFGCGEDVIGFRTWDKVREQYPEESGVRPIVIGTRNQFIHFPNKKDGKSLFYVRNPKWDDEFSRITSTSVDELDEDKTIIKYWKNKCVKNREKRREFREKHPYFFRDRTGGEK